MKNNGFELVVNYDNLETSRDRLGFNVGLNFTYIDNKVTKFQGGNSPDQLYLIREDIRIRLCMAIKRLASINRTKKPLNICIAMGLSRKWEI